MRIVQYKHDAPASERVATISTRWRVALVRMGLRAKVALSSQEPIQKPVAAAGIPGRGRPGLEFLDTFQVNG